VNFACFNLKPIIADVKLKSYFLGRFFQVDTRSKLHLKWVNFWIQIRNCLLQLVTLESVVHLCLYRALICLKFIVVVHKIDLETVSLNYVNIGLCLDVSKVILLHI